MSWSLLKRSWASQHSRLMGVSSWIFFLQTQEAFKCENTIFQSIVVAPKKIIKKYWLTFKNDLLIYYSIENAVHRKLLSGNIWIFLHTSNCTRKQALYGGSSDWAFSKHSFECKLLQTLVKSLKICLKEVFVVKLVFYIVQNMTFFIVFPNIKRVHWDSLARIQKTHL